MTIGQDISLVLYNYGDLVTQIQSKFCHHDNQTEICPEICLDETAYKDHTCRIAGFMNGTYNKYSQENVKTGILMEQKYLLNFIFEPNQ